MMVLLEGVGTGPVASLLGSIAMVIPSPVGGILLSPPTPSAPPTLCFHFQGLAAKIREHLGVCPFTCPASGARLCTCLRS
jgi:hypothetical protein